MSNWDFTFLQALGWSTLNSIWQMAFLWAIFLLVHHTFSLSSNTKYKLALGFVLLGFASYVATFLHYFLNNRGITAWSPLAFFNLNKLPLVLNAASVTYLVLLAIPVCRIVKAWMFIQKIKSENLLKVPLPYRLFVQKLKMQLGISRHVNIHFSKLVVSPITVGFLKPVILLPLAVVNNLTTQQIEAILLHELAHIRRYDYLVNLILTSIGTILYFNPFIKAFLKQIEIERESCCDELVVQFEYDPVDYALALVQLETAQMQSVLAMAVAHKNNLLHRIEKIVGHSRRKKFETARFATALLGLLMLVAVNSIFHKPQPPASSTLSIDMFMQPSALFMYPTESKPANAGNYIKEDHFAYKKPTTKKADGNIFSAELFTPAKFAAPAGLLYASYNETNTPATEKQQVKSIISNTKKVLAAQWSDVETAMADAMSDFEKAEAKKDYLNQLNDFDWEKLEEDLQTSYNKRNWVQIKKNLTQALAKAQLDSMENSFDILLTELHKMENRGADTLLALPDVSINAISKAKATIKIQLEIVRKAKSKKVIRL